MHLTIQFSLWHSNISHTFCEYGKFAPASTVQVRCPTACWCGQTSALLSSVSQLWPAQAAGLAQGFQTPHSHIPQHWGCIWTSRRWKVTLFPSPALGVPELEHSFSFNIILLVSFLVYHQDLWKLLQSHIMTNTCCHSDSSKFCSCHQ